MSPLFEPAPTKSKLGHPDTQPTAVSTKFPAPIITYSKFHRECDTRTTKMTKFSSGNPRQPSATLKLSSILLIQSTLTLDVAQPRKCTKKRFGSMMTVTRALTIMVDTR